MPRYAVPGEKDVDSLFAFAAAADLRVIYTLRLPGSQAESAAAIAGYVQQKYGPRLTCFEIGNEPDFYRRVYREIPDYPAYLGLWKEIAAAVRKTAPDAKFCGPAAGGATAWARRFAEEFGKSGQIAAIVQHEYPGGDGISHGRRGGARCHALARLDGVLRPAVHFLRGGRVLSCIALPAGRNQQLYGRSQGCYRHVCGIPLGAGLSALVGRSRSQRS